MHLKRICTLVATLALFAGFCSPSFAGQQVPRHTPFMYQQPGIAQPSAHGKTQVFAIGDSLTAGIGTILPRYFPGWVVGTDGRPARPLAEGMDVLARTELPENSVLMMGLFTNDDPRDVRALRLAVGESLRRVGPNGCVVWATIYRPAAGHGKSWYTRSAPGAPLVPLFSPDERDVSYHAANEALREIAAAHPQTMRLVHWSETVRRTHMKLDKWGIHPGTPAGWQKRAQLFADAARSC